MMDTNSAPIRCVLTADIIGSRKLTSDRLNPLIRDLENVIREKEPFVPGTTPKTGYIETGNAVNFLGDSFQFACDPIWGLDNMLKLRWYCKSYHLRWADDTPEVDLRVAMGLSLLVEDESLPYPLAYISREAMAGKGFNYNIVVAGMQDLTLQFFTNLYLLDAIILERTPKQLRSLLYSWELGDTLKAAELLGVANSTVYRSIGSVHPPIFMAAQQYKMIVYERLQELNYRGNLPND